MNAEDPTGPDPTGPADPEETATRGPDPTDPARSGLERLKASFFRPSRGQGVVAVLVALVAFAGITQVRTTGGDDDYASLRDDDLVQALNGLQAASRKAERDISRLEVTRDQLRDDDQARSTALRQAQDRLRTLQVLAGTVEANGPGIRITVSDPDKTLSLTHLLDGVEELRNAGVEAMEINDKVRVIAQTWFENGPDGIVVDGTPLESPYVIDAIGSPTTLSGALDFDGGFIEDVERDGATVEVQELDRVEVEVTRDPVAPRYARPVPGQ